MALILKDKNEKKKNGHYLSGKEIRAIAKENSVIMDGRDIGTCVLPDADLKIYLTASVEARANRRYKELLEKGEQPVLEDIAKDIEERDYRDMNRETSPLKQAEDAVLVDSSDMTIDEVVEAVELPGERFVVGVQWHPEELTEREEATELFRRFVQAAM